MSRESGSIRRLLLILLIVCASFNAQTSSFTAELETHDETQHCCGLCHIGPAPLLTSAATNVAAPVVAEVYVAPPQLDAAPLEARFPSAPSRAPPALV